MKLTVLASALPLSVWIWLSFMLSYHSIALVFNYLDRHKKLARFKVRQEGVKGYSYFLPRVLFNECFILLPCMLFCEYSGLAFSGTGEITVLQYFFYFACMGIGHDILQYCVHRGLLHHRKFRWLKHRLHHSTNASSSLSSCYMSSIDFFLEIVCPYLIPLILIGGNNKSIFFHLLVVSLGGLGGLYEHSGYDFSLLFREAKPESLWNKKPLLRIKPILSQLSSSHAHSEHHRRGNVSFSDGFGSPGLCDMLLSTRWDMKKPVGKTQVAQ